MAWKPIKILQIMECTIGGTRRHIQELCSGLSLRGHEVTVICSAQRDPTFLEDMESMGGCGVEVVNLPMVRSIQLKTDFKHFLFLKRFLKSRSFDLIHTHSSKAGVLGRSAALLSGSGPLVHTPHTFSFAFKGHFSWKKRTFFLAIERFLGQRTARLINVSPSEKQETIKYGILPKDRIRVVENGIDPWPFRWSEPPKEGKGLFQGQNRSPRLGTIGLLNPAKGHDLLLKAFARIRKQFPSAGLAIIGEGELRPELQGLILSLGLEGAAFLEGYRTDIPSVLKELDLFVFPSHWEGMPYVLMEAMASGLPAVVTDVNGSRDLVIPGETGLIVPPGDEAALADACLSILWDPKKSQSMGLEGVRRIMTRYTLEKMLDRMENLYFDLLEGRNP